MVTCYSSYPRKIYEKVTKCIIMLFRSYLTKLCKKRVIKTWTNERKTKRGATCKFWSTTVIFAWRELQVLWPVWPKLVAMTTKSCLARCRPSNKMSPWREWGSRSHVFQDQMSPWRQMSCLARKGGLGRVDDDVAEIHWARKPMSP